MSQYKFKFIDLFAGIGGFHLALMQLGGECVLASEIKKDLRDLYEKNFPGVPLNDDITKLDINSVPEHDMLCAGFPCQPFSKAGKRQGFNDEKDRGNMFNYICEVIAVRRPKYIFLENVANLRGHDGGNTWKAISERLDALGYNIKSSILSPHEVARIPQHRKRIYIVGIDKKYGDIDNFKFPTVKPENGKTLDIKKMIDESDTDYTPIKRELRNKLEAWQNFLDLCVQHGQELPTFPVWAMEFGADYEYEGKPPASQKLEQLRGKHGHLGKIVSGETVEQCLECLPVYARDNTNKNSFPNWKIRYIRQNREFYAKNKVWLDEWIKTVKDFTNSHLKFEWNCCGDEKVKPIIEDKIIQFRASGIRAKLATFSPALNLVSTQIPIFPWVNLPPETIKEGDAKKGRYMTVLEAAKIQGFADENGFKEGFSFDGLTRNRRFEALGNAVNVTVAKHIAEELLKYGK